MFSAFSSAAHASFIGPTVQALSVTGQLCCTSTGNCPGSPAPRAVVSLSCFNVLTLSSTVVAQNTTDVDGLFTITVPTTPGLILGLSKIPCVVTVQLPLDAAVCPALSAATGVLTGAVQAVGTATTPVLGRVQTARVSVFIQLRN